MTTFSLVDAAFLLALPQRKQMAMFEPLPGRFRRDRYLGYAISARALHADGDTSSRKLRGPRER